MNDRCTNSIIEQKYFAKNVLIKLKKAKKKNSLTNTNK